MLKAGIIGAGGMGRYHATRLAATGKVEIIGIADIDAERAESVSQELNSKSYTDHRKLLKAKPDMVFICTPPFARKEPVIDSAKAGVHIFAEKPIAISLKEADEMIAAVDKSRVKMMVGYVLHFFPTFRTLHTIFTSGQLGKLVACWTRRLMPWDPSGRWYADQSKSGGIAVDFASHDYDWLRWIGGDVRQIYGKVGRFNPKITADDDAWAIFTFDQGIGIVGDSWAGGMGDNSQGIIGTKGTIVVDRQEKIKMKLLDGEEQEIEPEQNIPSIQSHFIKCVEENLTPEVTARDGRAALEIALTIQRSSKEGKAINVR